MALLRPSSGDWTVLTHQKGLGSIYKLELVTRRLEDLLRPRHGRPGRRLQHSGHRRGGETGPSGRAGAGVASGRQPHRRQARQRKELPAAPPLARVGKARDRRAPDRRGVRGGEPPGLRRRAGGPLLGAARERPRRADPPRPRPRGGDRPRPSVRARAGPFRPARRRLGRNVGPRHPRLGRSLPDHPGLARRDEREDPHDPLLAPALRQRRPGRRALRRHQGISGRLPPLFAGGRDPGTPRLGRKPRHVPRGASGRAARRADVGRRAAPPPRDVRRGKPEAARRHAGAGLSARRPRRRWRRRLPPRRRREKAASRPRVGRGRPDPQAVRSDERGHAADARGFGGRADSLLRRLGRDLDARRPFRNAPQAPGRPRCRAGREAERADRAA